MRKLIRILILALFAVGIPTFASAAQPRSQLTVEIIDAANKPVPNALLELTPVVATGQVASTIERLPCDENGRCVANDLAAATYQVTVRSGEVVARLPQPIAVAAGRQNLVIRVAGGGAAEVVSLGVIRVAPTGTLSTASAPSTEINAQTLAGSGQPNVLASLAALPGVTLNRPNGGSAGLPASVMIRGDDPKEAIIQVDGNPVNNGNSGDFDLTLLDPAAFQTVQVVYGLAPASLVGANTEGGTVNFQTLGPTATPQGLLSYKFGSFVTNSYTFANTGTAGKVGYAFELHSFNQQGEVSSFPVENVQTGLNQTLGSAATGSNALAKLTYALPHDGQVEASILTLGYNADLSAALSSPVNPEDTSPGAPFYSYAGSERNDVNTFYSADVRLPVGHLTNTGSTPAFISANYLWSDSRQNVAGPANGLSEYLLNTTDLLSDYSLEYDRLLPDAQLTLVARAQSEILTAPDDFGMSTPAQSQTNHTFIARYTWPGGRHIEYTAVGYLSTFSTFGSSFNPRAAAVWRPRWSTVVRASVGSGFQAPALAEKVVPSPLPPPTANGLIEVGNPALSADHTLEFELDASQMLGSSAHSASGEIDLYRVNQNNDDIPFIPSGASLENPKLSYPINIADSIWQGVAATLTAPVASHLDVEMSYDINQGFPLSLPRALAGSAGNLVPHQQFESVPLHRATFSVQQQLRKLSWLVGLTYEGVNNDLSEPPFATVQANVLYELGHTTIGLAGTNLTGVYDGKFTLVNVGTPYPGLLGPILNDAYQLPGPQATVSLTQHW
jgi:outer membrane cobalamin receptor